jgi:hypothetical protein
MQAELFVSVGALGIVDAADDPRHLEDVLGDLRSHDVAVVAFGDGDESVSILDASAAEDVGVGAVADDLVALEVVGQHAARGRARELIGIAVDDDDLVSSPVHVGRDLGADASTTDDQDLQSPLIIGRLPRRSARALARIRPVRFPFTFMGVLALGIGAWVVFYLSAHRGLDPVAEAIAVVTALLCFGFGVYVLIRRVRRGPQH